MLVSLLLVLSSQGLQARAAASLDAASFGCGGWSVVPSPHPSTVAELLAVDAVSSTDIWAVGDYVVSTQYVALAEHWDGTAWTVVPTPQFAGNIYLEDVSAVSTDDVWAVGVYWESSGTRPLTEHWDGTAWSRVPAPLIGGQAAANYLGAVTAVAADDAWMAGEVLTPTGDQVPLVEHWDGTAWHPVQIPLPPTNIAGMLDIDAVSATDVWAIGLSQIPNASFTEHWDGTRWSRVALPPPEHGVDYLTSVSASASDNAWAVGDEANPLGGMTGPVTEHWDGSAWTRIYGRPVNDSGSFSAGAALAPDDVWAVGGVQDPQGRVKILAEHWDGTGWTVFPAQSPGVSYNALADVTAVSSVDLWAVGQDWGHSGGSMREGLIEHFCPA